MVWPSRATEESCLGVLSEHERERLQGERRALKREGQERDKWETKW